jgi:hypothetical protein
MPQKIQSLEELKEAAGNGADFFILLAGGIARSSKYISYDPTEDKFWIWNMIDDSEQSLLAKNVMKKQHGNIGEAIQKGCFFKDDT